MFLTNHNARRCVLLSAHDAGSTQLWSRDSILALLLNLCLKINYSLAMHCHTTNRCQLESKTLFTRSCLTYIIFLCFCSFEFLQLHKQEVKNCKDFRRHVCFVLILMQAISLKQLVNVAKISMGIFSHVGKMLQFFIFLCIGASKSNDKLG